MNGIDIQLTLVAGATAIGLSPYAALAAVGALGYVGLLGLPSALAGLAAPFLWGPLSGLTLVDGFLSRFRLTDIGWNALHTIVRPLSAFLFAAALLAAEPQTLQWLGSVAALLIALLVHTSVLAARTAARTAGPKPSTRGLTALRLFSAGCIAALAFAAPPVAGLAAAVLVLAPIAWLPRLCSTATLTLASVLYVLTRPDRLHEWNSGTEQLPRSLRRAVHTALGDSSGPIRHARATLARLGPRWPYYRGRIVTAADKPFLFVHRRGFQPKVIRLGATVGHADHAILVETIQVESPTPFSICLGPDAPPGPAVLTALQRSAAPGSVTEHLGKSGV